LAACTLATQEAGLHFDVKQSASRITGSHVKNRQFVDFVFFAKNWVEDFNLRDLNFWTQDRVEKVQRDRWMPGTTEHQLECLIDGGVNADGH